MSKNIKFKIRPVNQPDLDQLFDMLIELVKHEGIYERFKLTRTRLETELFGPNADWHCLVAVDEQENLLGFCLYTFANINRAFNTSSMIQVDDLYVKSECRNKGIAQDLLHELAKIAKHKNVGRLNVWCVRDNRLGQQFYNKIGAEKLEFVDLFTIQIEKLLA